MKNRRKSQRFDTAFQIKYYPVESRKRFGYTIAENISRGGLRMPALSTMVKTGKLVRLEMKENGEDAPIPAEGRVVWVRHLKRKALLNAEVGVEFTSVKSEDLAQLIPA